MRGHRSWIRKAAIVVVFAVLPVVILHSFWSLIGRALDEIESFYPDVQASGTLPFIRIPPSSKDIREVRNIDSSEVWLTFRFAESDLGVVPRSCRRAGNEEIWFARERVRNWWPSALVTTWPPPLSPYFGSRWGGPGPADEYHWCGDGFLAVDAVHNAAFYWTRGPYWPSPAASG